jgi:TonB family protein
MTSKLPVALTAAKKTLLAAAATIALAAPLMLGLLNAPAAAQGAPLTKPVWLEKPDGLSFERLYPPAAVAQKIDGKVLLGCTVLPGGRLSCAVKNEAPIGMGFGDAALAMYPEFKMAAQDNEGKSTTGRPVNVPILFKISE